MVAASGLMADVAGADDVIVTPSSKIEVIYFASQECPYCIEWQVYTWRAFKKTAVAQHVAWVVIEKGSLYNKISKRDYPREHQWMFDQAPTLGNVVPAWWLIVDGKPVHSGVGEHQWLTVIEPTIVRLVGEKLAAGGQQKVSEVSR